MQPLAQSAPLHRDMNVTPMIDVLLVLIVIFMMLNVFGRTTIRAEVPAPAATPAPPAAQLVLSLPAAGGYELNRQPVPKAELEETLRSVFANRPASLVFVSAAPTRKYQDVIEAMDVAKGAGVQIIAMAPPQTDTQ